MRDPHDALPTVVGELVAVGQDVDEWTRSQGIDPEKLDELARQFMEAAFDRLGDEPPGWRDLAGIFQSGFQLGWTLRRLEVANPSRPGGEG